MEDSTPDPFDDEEHSNKKPFRQGKHKKLYDSTRWFHLRTYQLRLSPLCEMCLRQGRLEPANTVDHVVPHEGDRVKFFMGKLQSLCFDCHNGEKKFLENRGFSDRVGADGWPLDSRHPVYRRR